MRVTILRNGSPLAAALTHRATAQPMVPSMIISSRVMGPMASSLLAASLLRPRGKSGDERGGAAAHETVHEAVHEAIQAGHQGEYGWRYAAQT